MGANIMGAVLSVLYAARSGLMDDEVRHGALVQEVTVMELLKRRESQEGLLLLKRGKTPLMRYYCCVLDDNRRKHYLYQVFSGERRFAVGSTLTKNVC